jgi:hypothetical protein
VKVKAAIRYADDVIHTLRPYFVDLTNEITADVIRQAIQRHAAAPSPVFEALLDAPGNWRLKPEGDSGRVRLACYRFHETDTTRELTARVNMLLDALEADRG